MAEAYHRMIEGIVGATGLPDSTLHVHVGLLIFFGSSLLFRCRLSNMRPLVIVGMAELFNECMDVAFSGTWQWSDIGLDVLHTMFWPLVITIGARIFQNKTMAAVAAGVD